MSGAPTTLGKLRAHAHELAWAIECHDDESVSACLVAISQSSLVPDAAWQRRTRRIALLCEAIAAHERGRNEARDEVRALEGELYETRMGDDA